MKNKASMTVGFSLVFAFCIFSDALTQRAVLFFSDINSLYVVGFLYILAFVVPIIATKCVRFDDDIDVSFRIKIFDLSTIPFIVYFGIAITLLSFIINNFLSEIFVDLSESDSILMSHWGENIWINILVVIIIPAITYELLFRGLFFSLLEYKHSTFNVIILTSIFYALSFGNMHNIVEPFVLALGFGLVSYWFSSVIPAIILHLIFNALTALLTFFTEMYFLIGFLYYIIVAIVIIFFISMYIALGKLEILLEEGKIKKFQKSNIKHISSLLEFIVSPAIITFILIFLSSAVLSIW